MVCEVSRANHRDCFAFGWKWVSILRWCSHLFQLMLTHFTSLPQFEYVSQHLVFANCIPLILKFFNQNIMSYITAKNRYSCFWGRERWWSREALCMRNPDTWICAGTKWPLVPSMALGQCALHYRNMLEGSKSLLLNDEDWMGGFQSLNGLLKYRQTCLPCWQ